LAHSYSSRVKFKIYALVDDSVNIVKEAMWQLYVEIITPYFYGHVL
jgi:hypothetical protein